MTTTPAQPPGVHRGTSATGEAVTADPRRWWALVVIAVSQLMVSVDATIVNVALPSAQRDLDLSGPARQWVITAYALGYGSLLLLGGRLTDLLGRRRSLLLGLAGFALASAAGGAAVNATMLLTARGLQGAFGALLTPAVLALLSTTFPTAAERGKAFGIYATIMGSGSGIGVLLGGVLTDYLNWRWSLYVTVPIAAAAGAGALWAIRPTPRTPGLRVDLPGALLATGGLAGLVLGFSSAETRGWVDPTTLGALAAGVVLLGVFVRVQSRVATPLLPLRVLRDRRRATAYLAMLTWGLSIIAAFLFLSFYLQNVLGYPPMRAGLAFLPYTAAILLGVRITKRLLMRVPVRVLLVPGLLSIAAGLLLLGLLDADSGYWAHVLPIFVLLGLGTSAVLPPANSTATLGAGQDTGVAGAMAMTSTQVGVSLGTALLGTIAGVASANYAAGHAGAPDLARTAAVHGYNLAGLTGAAVVAAAAVVVFLLGGNGRPVSS